MGGRVGEKGIASLCDCAIFATLLGIERHVGNSQFSHQNESVVCAKYGKVHTVMAVQYGVSYVYFKIPLCI